jgi:hypothetical protein
MHDIFADVLTVVVVGTTLIHVTRIAFILLYFILFTYSQNIYHLSLPKSHAYLGAANRA